ncbi:MAG: hypothetical protein IJL17_05140 [Kiritimatiellae bacterium]|nr:hypothetical protein [Kiritimatiellia bacterium]
MRIHGFARAGLALIAIGLVSGCYTIPPPLPPPPPWPEILAKQIPVLGTNILNSPVIRDSKEPILLKIGGMLDKSRLTVDTELLMRMMRTHLVNNGYGRIVVFNNDADVAGFIEDRNRKRMHEVFKDQLRYLAGKIVKSAMFRGRNVQIAVMPPDVSAHLKGINADGFIALLRDEIAASCSGNITFLPGNKAGDADYLLRGNFTAFSMTDEVASGGKEPNADMNLRIMFVEPSSGESCFEVSLPARKKLFDPSLDATLILSGELNDIARETPSTREDYVRMGFNIVDPDTSTHRYETACEISATTYKPVYYQ